MVRGGGGGGEGLALGASRVPQCQLLGSLILRSPVCVDTGPGSGEPFGCDTCTGVLAIMRPGHDP